MKNADKILDESIWLFVLKNDYDFFFALMVA